MMVRMVQKRLFGELIGWDPEEKILQVKFKKWWETGRYTEATATFGLDPYAIVTSAYRGTLRLSELQIGRRVTVTYITEPGGHQVAKTLTVSTTHAPVSKPLALPE